MNCDPRQVTEELHNRLLGKPQDEKLELARRWLEETLRDCPENDAFWRALFHIVTAQIVAGQAEIRIIEGKSMSSLYRLMAIIFGVLAGMCIVGGVVAIIWNAVSPTEFNILGIRLSTGHVGVAFVGIGMVTALVLFRSILTHLEKIEKK